MKNQNQTPPILVRRSQAKSVFGLSASTLDRLEKDGKWPKRRRVGPGCVGWLYDEAKTALESLAKPIDAA
jgi:predicted DNA-binding transcriptional regulator AlpA